MKDLSDSEDEEAYVPTDGDETHKEEDIQDHCILDVDTRQPASETGKNGRGTSLTIRYPFSPTMTMETFLQRKETFLPQLHELVLCTEKRFEHWYHSR